MATSIEAKNPSRILPVNHNINNKAVVNDNINNQAVVNDNINNEAVVNDNINNCFAGYLDSDKVLF